MQGLPVNEIFETIQGEGHHVGRGAIFIRMQGCNVGCPWCDTRHTWHVDAARMAESMGALVLKESSDDHWFEAGPELLAEFAERHRARHVVLTGGEPCTYDLTDLSAGLIARGFSVQVETSGTHEIRIDPAAWVTVSPKLNMPGGLEVRDDAIGRADEIKMPIGKADDLAALIHLLDRGAHRPDALIYLQPISLNRRATELCKQAAIANGWRVSLQVHALAGWR
jgi:7-carboxy-7-deazaguanine synthase